MNSSGYDYTPLPTRDSSRQQNISIVAIIILVVVAIAIFIVWCLKCRKKKSSNTPQSQQRLINREVTSQGPRVIRSRVDQHGEMTHSIENNHDHGTQRTRVHSSTSRATHGGVRETRATIEHNSQNHQNVSSGRSRIRTRATINLINSTTESRSEPSMINQSGLPPLYDELERRKSMNSPQSPTPPSYEEFMATPDKYSKCP